MHKYRKTRKRAKADLRAGKITQAQFEEKEEPYKVEKIPEVKPKIKFFKGPIPKRKELSEYQIEALKEFGIWKDPHDRDRDPFEAAN